MHHEQELLRNALESFRRSLEPLAQQHPDVASFIAEMTVAALPLVTATPPHLRERCLQQLVLCAAEVGVPIRIARAALAGALARRRDATVDLFAVDRDVARRGDAEPDLLPLHGEHGDLDVVADPQDLAEAARQDEHVVIPGADPAAHRDEG